MNWKQLCSSSFQDFIVALLLLSLCGKSTWHQSNMLASVCVLTKLPQDTTQSSTAFTYIMCSVISAAVTYIVYALYWLIIVVKSIIALVTKQEQLQLLISTCKNNNLVASCCAIELNNVRNDLVQVTNVFPALFRCHCGPKLHDSSHELLLGGGLDFTSHVLSRLMPQVLRSRDSAGLSTSWLSYPPPPLFHNTWCMLRVIIQHETVSFWIHLFQEWDECLI